MQRGESSEWPAGRYGSPRPAGPAGRGPEEGGRRERAGRPGAPDLAHLPPRSRRDVRACRRAPQLCPQPPARRRVPPSIQPAPGPRRPPAARSASVKAKAEPRELRRAFRRRPAPRTPHPDAGHLPGPDAAAAGRPDSSGARAGPGRPAADAAEPLPPRGRRSTNGHAVFAGSPAQRPRRQPGVYGVWVGDAPASRARAIRSRRAHKSRRRRSPPPPRSMRRVSLSPRALPPAASGRFPQRLGGRGLSRGVVSRGRGRRRRALIGRLGRGHAPRSRACALASQTGRVCACAREEASPSAGWSAGAPGPFAEG